MLPQQCVLCAAGTGDHWLCAACAGDLPWHDGAACPVCALPAGTAAVCGECLRHPPAFDATFALLDYRFPVDALLQRYKYSGLLAVAGLMGTLLSARVQNLPRPDIIIPMPLHPTRLKERGFNQSTEIARTVARQLGIPLASRTCSRIRPTQPQAGLSPQERARNLRGAFACAQDLSGQHIVLLDDVMTTATSLDALARTVKNAGAARVDCWVIARTLKS